MDKQSQRVAWRVGTNSSVIFDTQLSSLTQPTGAVTLRFDNGKSQQWTLARFEADSQAAR